MPGDRVEVSDGRVFVNGAELDESSYILSRPTYTYPTGGIPPDVPREKNPVALKHVVRPSGPIPRNPRNFLMS